MKRGILTHRSHLELRMVGYSGMDLLHHCLICSILPILPRNREFILLSKPFRHKQTTQSTRQEIPNQLILLRGQMLAFLPRMACQYFPLSKIRLFHQLNLSFLKHNQCFHQCSLAFPNKVSRKVVDGPRPQILPLLLLQLGKTEVIQDCDKQSRPRIRIRGLRPLMGWRG